MSDEAKKDKHEINPSIADFLKVVEEESAPKKESSQEEKRKEPEDLMEIEEAGESMALLYEKVRNTIEYSDDHLIKRNAIERILKRNFLIEFRQQDFSGQFLTELVIAGYLHRQQINKELREKIKKIIAKYRTILKATGSFDSKRWLVSIASCEIEEAIFPQPTKRALERAMFGSLRDRLKIQDGTESDKTEKDIQLFISVQRSLVRTDNVMLNYSLAKIFFPELFERGITEREKEAISRKISKVRDQIESKLDAPLGAKILSVIRKYAVYFNILFETTMRNSAKAGKIISDPESLKFAAQLTCEDVYKKEMTKFRKRVRRSLIFLIITKVALAVLVEYPYERYILGSVNLVPIYINLLFPPLFLLFLSSTVHEPSKENSTLIAKGISEIAYKDEKNNQGTKNIYIKKQGVKSTYDLILTGFFWLTFLISFGLVIWVLRVLNFDWFGVLIFLFLFSLVSFFSALVRQPIRQLIIIREKEGVMGMILDTLFFPFVRIGKWMSVNFSRVNVFLFLFDVILEAPFKVVVRFVQEWAGFIRSKKEEMI